MRFPGRSSEQLLLAGKRLLGLTRLGIERGSHACCQLGAALDCHRSVLRRQVAGAQLVGGVLQLGDELLELRGHAASSVRFTAPRMPFTKLGASAAQSSL